MREMMQMVQKHGVKGTLDLLAEYLTQSSVIGRNLYVLPSDDHFMNDTDKKQLAAVLQNLEVPRSDGK